MIHDTLFSSQEVNEIPVEVRWLYLAAIVHADDEGRMRADPHFLKLKAFPFDAYSVDQVRLWRDQLTSKGMISLYEVGSKEYLYHPKWKKWQTLRKDRLKPSDCPPPATNCQPTVNQVSTKCQPLVAQGSKEVSKEVSKTSLLTSTAAAQPPPLGGASATRENSETATPMTTAEMHEITLRNLGKRSKNHG